MLFAVGARFRVDGSATMKAAMYLLAATDLPGTPQFARHVDIEDGIVNERNSSGTWEWARYTCAWVRDWDALRNDREAIWNEHQLTLVDLAMSYANGRPVNLHDAGGYAARYHGPAAAVLGMTRHSFGTRLGEARAAFLRLWHEHEAPSRLWCQDGLAGGAASGPPGGRVEVARVLADVRDVFGGQDRAATADLLACFAAADPVRYGNWTPKDLAGFLRPCGAPSRTIRAVDGEGRRRKCQGYRLGEVTRAIQDLHLDLAAPGVSAGQAA